MALRICTAILHLALGLVYPLLSKVRFFWLPCFDWFIEKQGTQGFKRAILGEHIDPSTSIPDVFVILLEFLEPELCTAILCSCSSVADCLGSSYEQLD